MESEHNNLFILQRRDIIALSIIAVVNLSIVTSATFKNIYIPFSMSSILLLTVVYVLSRRSGLVSIPTIVATILMYPLLVPFITRYIYNVSHFTIRAVQFESDVVANKITTLGLLTIMILYFTFLIGRIKIQSTSNYSDWISEPYLSSNLLSFSTLIAIFLGCAYLTAPGPTILSTTYQEGANTIPGWAVFAPAVFKSSWSLMFVIAAQKASSNTYYILFSVATVIGTIWLLLHGRRVESVGILLLYSADIYWHRVGITESLGIMRRLLLYSVIAGIGLMMVLVGRLRKGATDVTDLFGLDYGNGFIGVPGGGHGIYATSQATYSLFNNKIDYLIGRTFLQYPLEAIPTGLQQILAINTAETFREFLATQYNYNGGNYLLNVYYANFGVLGHLLAGVLLGLATLFIYRKIQYTRPEPKLTTAIAVLLFINLIRATWYSQLYLIDSLQGLVLVLPLYMLSYGFGNSYLIHK